MLEGHPIISAIQLLDNSQESETIWPSLRLN